MVGIKATILLAGALFAVSQMPQDLNAQGKGGGKGNSAGKAEGQAKGKGPEKVRGEAQGKAKGPEKAVARGTEKERGPGAAKGSPGPRAEKNRGRGNFVRPVSLNSLPAKVRSYAASGHARDVIVAGAVAHAYARGRGDDVRIEQRGEGVRLLNRRGDPLLFIDDRTARDLGRWRVGVLDDEVREGAPSFCRSGAGHPVWGREWCIDKGFGLGAYQDYRWGRTRDVSDIIYSRGTLQDRIMGTALENLLGTSTFTRLALHAVTLGLLDPLVGRFVGEPAGPQYLAVNSGTYPVAELYDTNRDNRWDDLLVALRSW